MKGFSFHAEIFEHRAAALTALSDHGLAWLSDFGAIDPLHDLHGLEVTGIRDQAVAETIGRLLQWLLPHWRHRRIWYEDMNSPEIGWRVVISRDPEEFDDRWDRAG